MENKTNWNQFLKDDPTSIFKEEDEYDEAKERIDALEKELGLSFELI